MCVLRVCVHSIFVRAERTNTCPMCKERFTAVRHKCGDNNKAGGGVVGPRPVRAGEIVEVSERKSERGDLCLLYRARFLSLFGFALLTESIHAESAKRETATYRI